MTHEEAKGLKPGRLVLVRRRSGSIIRARVVKVCEPWPLNIGVEPLWLNVVVRRDGRTRAGALYPEEDARPDMLSWPSPFDPQPANVYADWLEENGHPRAAALLREAFPLADGR